MDEKKNNIIKHRPLAEFDNGISNGRLRPVLTLIEKRILNLMKHKPCIIRVVMVVAIMALLAPAVLSAREFRGRGDFEFFLDEAVFRQPGGSMLQDLYIRLTNSELRFEESGGGFKAKIKFAIVIKDDQGNKQVDDTFTMEFREPDEKTAASSIDFQTIIKQYLLQPGQYHLTCMVEDRLSTKMTMISMAKGNHKTSKVHRVTLIVPPPEPDLVSVSDPVYLWNIDRLQGKPIIHPNPPRIYGLYKDSLRVYLELYLPDSLADLRVLRFEAVILNENGEIETKIQIPLIHQAVTPRGGDLTVPGGYQVCPVVLQADLNTFDAGRYSFYADTRLNDRLISRFRCGDFSVAWDMRTWETTRSTYFAEARFLLGDEEFDRFLLKNYGEQEQMLNALWEKIDPSPHSAVNESYEKFKDRLAYIHIHFADNPQGVFSDRGLIYLKYGPPDEVIEEVVPLNRESIADAMEKVENRYHPVSFSNQGVRSRARGLVKDVIVDPHRIGVVGEGGNTVYPYELWVYNGFGDPILSRDRALEPDIGIRFIFIDREGFGRYKLESSSSMTDK